MKMNATDFHSNQYSATYSPEDNKLRLYAVSRLDSETLQKAKELGFKYAPKQGLFVAPAWTPAREDLLFTLVDEIDDEDTSLVDRAEERAERFTGYRERRYSEAEQAYNASKAISSSIPFGQPILVGHHSERRARKDADRIHNLMGKSVKLWDTAQYWKARAEGAKRHAKYKERADVRYRRIKGLQADLRKAEKYIKQAETFLKLWNQEGLTMDKAKAIANYDHISACFPLAEYPREEPASQYEGAKSLWSALQDGIISEVKARDLATSAHDRTIRHQMRWKAHYENRLAYEKAMLEEGGGLAGALHDYAVGGMIKTWHGWNVIKKINRKDGVVNSLSVVGAYGTITIDEVKEYKAPEAGAAEKVKAATKKPPLCNYPGPGFEEMSSEDWKKLQKTTGSAYITTNKATATIQAHRIRTVYGSGSSRRVGVYLTDAKRVDPPTVPEKIEDEQTEIPAGELANADSEVGNEASANPIKELASADLENEVIAATIAEKVANIFTEEGEAPRMLEAGSNETDPGEKFQLVREQLKKGPPPVVVVTTELYPTPRELARRVVSLASIQADHRILEPSAGTGALLEAVLEVAPEALITAVEANYRLTQDLMEKFPDANIHHNDFLDYELNCCDPQKFDCVVMNPPFSGAQDIKHIKHALTLLKPGGRLVAICAGGPRQEKALAPLATIWEPLPPNTFKESGTAVNSVLLVIDAV